MTILFTDMEGSTAFASAHGDEVAVALLRDHERVIRYAAEAQNGRVVKSTGDGFLVVFPTCTGGVAGALEMRARLEELASGHPADAPRVRFGLNFGSVIEEQGDVFGLAVNAAARIAAKARSGQVLLSEAVREQVDAPAYTFVDRGLFWLKGLREQWRLFEATDGEFAEPARHLEGRAPFVGREAEQASLREGIGRASGGQGGLVVVTGDAGVGKTRLVAEVGIEAEARGFQFVAARCESVGKSDPYLPFVEVLDASRRRMSAEQFRVCLGDDAGAIARLLPVIRRMYREIPPPARMPAREERRYLFGAVGEVLANLARVRPMVILLDDVHWADEHSLLLLESFAVRLPDLPIFVAATYTRDESVPAALRETLVRLQRRNLMRSIVLNDLAPADVEALLMTIAGSTPPPDVVNALHQATQGNPFFLDAVLRQFADEGLLVAGGGWRTVLLRDIDVPESARLTIENRLESLRDDTRRILTTVCLLGRDFGFELLEALQELPENELVDALDEAERARIITSSVEGESVRFTFAHDLIRRTLSDGITLVNRQRLHARLADALEQVNATALPEHAASIAYHLEHAGRWADPDRTIRFLVMAGERALEAAAYGDAIAYFEQAWERLGHDATATRARVLEGLGTAERSLGHLDAALERWGDALDAMEEQGDALAVARLCLSAAIQVALWRRGDLTMRLLDRGMLALGDRPSAYRAGFCALAGQLASQAGDYDRAEDEFREAIDAARAHDDDGMLGLALYSQAAHHFQYHQYALTLDEGRESIAHLRRAGDLWNVANVMGYLGTSLGWLGRFGDAADAGREGLALAERLGNWSAYVFAEQSQTFQEFGRHPDAAVLEQRGRYALELGSAMGFPWMMSVGHTRVGQAMFWAGRWGEAVAEFEAAARLEGRSAAGGHLGRLFLMHAYLGNRQRALELIDAARPEFPVRGRQNSTTKWGLAAAAVEAFAVLGATEEAASLYDAMVELAATGSLMRSWDYRLLDTLCGISAACAGDWTLAEGHYQDAIQRATELPMRLEVIDAGRFYARMLHLRGLASDREAARAMAAEAIDGYEALGMPRHALLARSVCD